MTFAIVENNVVTNLIEATEHTALLLNALPYYKGCVIGQKYSPSTPEDIILDTLADHEYRLCLTELGIN